MSELTSTLKVVVDGSGARSGAAQVSAAMNSMAQSAGSSVDSLNIKVKSFNDMLKRVQNSSFSFLKSLANTAVVAGFTNAIIKANRELSAFMAISKVSRGSEEGAMESFRNIEQISNLLGTSLEHNIRSFGKFEAAMRPVDKTGQLTQHMFEALTIASSGLHLSSLQLELSFKAIEQAASKNKPTLEEFQRQLAEHIPGAMAHLAEGVGLRMDQIHGAISKGTISIRDLLTGFANVLKSRFGEAAEYAAKQLPAALERMRNAIFMFNVEIGRAGAAEALIDISKAVIELVSNAQTATAIGRMFKDIGGSLAEFIRSITPADISRLQKALELIISVIITFIKNLKLIFETLIAGIIGRYIGLIITNYLKIRDGAIAAGAGISILSKSMLALRAALGGPGGVIALLFTLLPLLAKLGRDDAEDKIQMDLINKQRMLASYEKSIEGINKQIIQVGNSNLSTDQKIFSINGLYDVAEKLKISRDKLAAELNGISEEQLSFDALLSQMELPGDKSLAELSGSDKKDKDPLAQYIDDTTIKRMEEYYKLTGLLNARFENGDPTKLSREQYALWVETYRKINEEFVTDVFENGAYKTFDPAVAEMIKSQQDSYAELQGDLYDASEELKDLQVDYSRELQSVSDELFGNVFQAKFSEISDWIQDETKKFDSMQISPEVRKQLTEMIGAIAHAKYKLAEFQGVQEVFSKSQATISAKEQELQARVLTGLISESEARITLRGIIGEQGKALSDGLLPIIEDLMASITDPTILASLKAIQAEIAKMVEIGSQTTAFKGLTDGLKEVANYTTDTYTEMKSVVIDAFESLEEAIVDFVVTGKASMSDFVDSIKSDLVRLAAKEYISKPLSAALLGGISGSANASGGGGFDSILGLGSSLLAPGALSLKVGGLTASILEFAGATTGVATGIGAFVSTALPIVGAILAIGTIFGVFGGKPSNKAAFGDINLATGETSTSEMTGDKAPSQETMTARDSILQAIGGWAAIIKQLGGELSDSIRVDIGERDGIQFAINGGPLKSYGSDPNLALEKLFKELTAGVTGLEEPFKTLISNFEGTVDELLNFGLALIVIDDYINSDILATAEELANVSKMTDWDVWTKSVSDIRELTAAFDGSSESATNLANASLSLYQQELALIQQINAAIASIAGMFTETIKGIEYDMLETDAEKYDYLRTQADGYFAELQTATDPARIAELAGLIDSIINQSWNLLDPAQKALYGPEFIKYTQEVNALADERLNLALEQVVNTHDDIVANIAEALAGAAATMQGAADTMQAAANTPVQVQVEVEYPNNGYEVGYVTYLGPN